MSTKHLVSLAVLAIAAIAISACGGGGGGSNSGGGGSTTPQFPSMAGNWDVIGTSQVSTGATFEAGGAFNQTGGNISGTIRMLDSCYDISVAVTLTGTVSSAGVVSLAATAPDGGRIQVSGNVSADGGTMSGAQYSVTGGCAGGDHGTLQATRIAPVTGTFNGTFHSSRDGSSISVTANLTQGTGAGNLGGSLFSGSTVLSGTVQIPGGVCFTSGTSQEGFVIGSLLYALINTSNGQVQVLGTISSDGRRITDIEYKVHDGTCDGDFGDGTLSR